MRLIVKQNDRLVNQNHFIKGPIYIGRHSQSQVFLPHQSVSRQHAVVFLTDEKQWMIKDLNSANKTYLNGKAITETLLRTGDSIKVGDYTIDVDMEKDEQVSKSIHLEDTHAPVARQPQLIVRELDNKLAPAIRIPAHRAVDLYELLRMVAHGDNSAETLKILLDVLIDQFQANRVWCAFRYDPEGYTEEEGGRTNTGEYFELKHETIKKLIEQACQKRQYLLLSNITQQSSQPKRQSAIIAPILGSDRIFGEIYLESKPESVAFTMSDLDYAMLIAISLSVIIENF